jgi:beta-glucosidase
VGYRWFDQHGIKPLFPLGYGLSYTKFRYSDLKVKPADIPDGVKFAPRTLIGFATPYSC